MSWAERVRHTTWFRAPPGNQVRIAVVLLDAGEPVEPRIDERPVGARPAGERVGRPILVVEPDVAGAADQRVAPGAAVQLVVSGTAVEAVVPAEPLDQVVAAETADHVRPGRADEMVIADRAADR